MGRHLSPSVKQNLAKLEQDGECRRSALTSLKTYVEKLDSDTMPSFLTQLSESKELESSRHYAVLLFEVMARHHGRLVVPHIPRIIGCVTRSLYLSGGDVRKHEACAKVVVAIPRHAIDPTMTTAMEAQQILKEVGRPLLEVLAGKFEPLTAGAALCLQALVESEKWKLASSDLVSELCSKVATALKEKVTQSEAHMHLARSLARANANNMEQHGGSLLRFGREILENAAGSDRWRNRLCAVQLIRAMIPVIDGATLASELQSTEEILDKFKLDRMQHVRNEVAKALQTLKTAVQKEPACALTPNRSEVPSGNSDGETSLTMSETNSRMCATSESQLTSTSPLMALTSDSEVGFCSPISSLDRKLQPSSSATSKKFQLNASKLKPKSASSSSIDSDYSFASLKPKENGGCFFGPGMIQAPIIQNSPVSAGESCENASLNQTCAVGSHTSLCTSKLDQEHELYYGESNEDSSPNFYRHPVSVSGTVPEADCFGDRDETVISDSLHTGVDPSSIELYCQKGPGNGVSHMSHRILPQSQLQGLYPRSDAHSVADLHRSNVSEIRLPQGGLMYKSNEVLAGEADQIACGFRLTRCGQNGVTGVAGHAMPQKEDHATNAQAIGGKDLLMTPSKIESRVTSQKDAFAGIEKQELESNDAGQETPPVKSNTITAHGSYIPQKNCLMGSPDHFLIYSTPRRLIRSLQSLSHSPDIDVAPGLNSKVAEDCSGLADVEIETSSDAAWSVRHNPIAEAQDSDKSKLASSIVSQESSSPCNLGLLPDSKSTGKEKGRLREIFSHSYMKNGGSQRTDAFEGGMSETNTDSHLSMESSGNSGLVRAVQGMAGLLTTSYNIEDRKSSTKEMWCTKSRSFYKSKHKSAASSSLESEQSNGGGWQFLSQGCNCVNSDHDCDHKTMFEDLAVRKNFSRYCSRFFKKVNQCLIMLFGGSLCAVLFLALAMILVRLSNPKHNFDLVPT